MIIGALLQSTAYVVAHMYVPSYRGDNVLTTTDLPLRYIGLLLG
jgi:hypothetical protein